MTRSTSVSRQVVLEVADGELPGRVRPAEVALDVLGGDLGEVRAALVAVQHALVADGAQQEAAERAGADPRLDDAGAGEDVGHRQDLPRVLGVDHGGAAGHGQDVVGEQGAQREIGDVSRGSDNAALGSADQLVVREGTLVGVELLPCFEREGVVASLGVGELDLVPDSEGPASAGGTGRFGHVTTYRASPGSAGRRGPGRGPTHGCGTDGVGAGHGGDGRRAPRPRWTARRRSRRSARRPGTRWRGWRAGCRAGPRRRVRRETRMPGVRSWVRPLTATQGRRCSGTPTIADSRTSAVGSPWPSTTTSARAPASLRPAQRLGQRGVGADRDGAPGEGAGAAGRAGARAAGPSAGCCPRRSR